MNNNPKPGQAEILSDILSDLFHSLTFNIAPTMTREYLLTIQSGDDTRATATFTTEQEAQAFADIVTYELATIIENLEYHGTADV